MTLTKIQHQELDSLRSQIIAIEKRIDNTSCQLDLAIEFGDVAEISKLESVMSYGWTYIERKITIQAESMKLEYTLMVDLIFDREHTLKVLNSES